MEFENFITLVKEKVERMMGAGYRVEIRDVRKNNGVALRGLTVIQDDGNIAPVIYLDDAYEEYVNGRATLIDVVSDVMDTYHGRKVSQCKDMNDLKDYGNVKRRIVYRLVNTEKNKELLGRIPHKDYLDLSIVFRCIVQCGENGEASFLIHNTHKNVWGVSVDDLYQAAVENTPRLMPGEIKGMADILGEIMKAEDPGGLNGDDCVKAFSDSVPIYVLSNKDRVGGAACMLYPHLLRDFADAVGSSLYIIPSSVHELLLLPVEHDEDGEEIKDMIRDVNDTQVSAEEILSYSLYFYNREEGKTVRL